MDVVILRTNISHTKDFYFVKAHLERSFRLSECTIDLDDSDKVVRLIGDNLSIDKINSHIVHLGFNSEELPD